ncbi:MAG: adenylate/guanylate cyclase domain-containing protein [Pseudomonadota bacterium]
MEQSSIDRRPSTGASGVERGSSLHGGGKRTSTVSCGILASAKRINLRILLVCAITGLVLAGIAGATLLQVQSFRAHAREEADRALAASARAVEAKAEQFFAPASALARHIFVLPRDELAGATDKRGSQFDRFLRTVELIPDVSSSISAAYIGYPEGSFVLINRYSQSVAELAGLPQDARTGTIRLERDATAEWPVDRWSWQGPTGWRSHNLELFDYDPRSRPWYRLAEEAIAPAWTPLYRSVGDQGVKMTLSAPLRDGRGRLVAVLGVDISLDALIAFVSEIKIGERGFAFLARENGTLLAHPSLRQSAIVSADLSTPPTLLSLARSQPLHLRAFEAFVETQAATTTIEQNGEALLARRIPLDESFGLDAALYVGAPLSDFTASADAALRTALIFTAAMSAGVLAIGVLIARAIARPIGRAAETMQAIAALKEMDSAPVERSVLAEIDALNGSVEIMRAALRSFSRLVPVELVRDLVDLRQPIELGGRRREITVLFTDIEGFTRMTETEQHERMIEGLADYFDIICAVISEHGGTIDKFIGDSIMAFWGAPRDDADHTEQACKAVVEIIRQLDAFNKARMVAGEPPLNTRFGLHRGYAFVGNVGSRHRFGYTALGDVVNTASRLEAANKSLGTTVLVSQAVAANTSSDVRLLPRGEIALDGKAREIAVFELDTACAEESTPPLRLVARR